MALSGCALSVYLKGYGNEADFPRFLHKSVRYWSLTLNFCSDFGFEFAEIFVIEKRLPDSASREVGESESQLLNVKTLLFSESESRRLTESESRYSESWSRYSNFFKFIIDLQNLK